MMRYILFLFCFSLNVLIPKAQEKNLPFSIRLEQMEIPGMPALHSFAFASRQGKWLLVAGRKDGLHRKQPWATFDEDGQNKFIYVVDPIHKQVWKQRVENLPVSIAEQLQSTNMQFFQVGNNLVLTGGYGYSKTAGDHITFPYLTILKLDEIINDIINGKAIDNSIKQIKDERVAVTGGRMGKLGDTLLLAGGQRFEGRYNPMGPDHGPGFTQDYTNEIRKFLLEDKNASTEIKYYSAVRDSINLHRRDYNLVPQVFTDNEQGYTMYSGVFQYDENLPFTNFVDIVGGTYRVNNEFNQQFSHYHSALLPIYDKEVNTMFSIFFGGIAQYYPAANGKVVNNKDVPFTKTISVIIRNKENIEESYLSIQMPGYLGAAAEFIFMPDTKMYSDGIADASFLKKEEILIGYIVGGIHSSEKNIFWDNTGKESTANGKIIKVYIKSLK